ncbi:hypothetical protein HMJ29_02025 [Hymenobacter taeanensis]|uniref:Uncharacterized protein n=1 Tax=Hymenobacter taeanensis TaxID=2735321 RepID=A0A6M6BDF5_9BACT|nr:MULTISPECIES: hypothetical protein [Hymenobacter]QJX45774.1 hypothetical protein HMJ29_02025 [Hymenobacter taeanensis]UOQ79618.1 hypothetical protein MUN83_12235 [Hymenobacter sp. 5414T-23]
MPYPYEQLLQVAFPEAADAKRFLSPATLAAYDTFRQATSTDIAFRFERVRLGVALALMKLLADLGDHEESRRVMDVLHRALASRSVKEIDATITKEAKVFEKLYTNLYVNEDGELLLGLFERTLDADTQPLMDGVIREALEVAAALDFSHYDEDEDDQE